MNSDIKVEIFSAGLKQWQIAKELNIDESTFSKKLNRDILSDTFKARIKEAINKLKKEDI